jgi:hypothetical protein
LGGDYADRWEIVNLPAIAQEPSDLNDWLVDPLGRKVGEALWKESFPVPALERIRRNSAFPRYWYALYQQNPIPDEGDMFTVAEIGKRTADFRPANPCFRSPSSQNCICRWDSSRTALRERAVLREPAAWRRWRIGHFRVDLPKVLLCHVAQGNAGRSFSAKSSCA